MRGHKYGQQKGALYMPKRGENIRKRKDGRWEARYKDENGKYKSVYGRTYREVKEKLLNQRTAKERRTAGAEKLSPPAVLFQSVCEAWLNFEKEKIKISSYSTYSNIVYNHLIPFFGDMDIQKINFQKDIATFIEKMIMEKLSAKRIKEIIQRLKQILKFMEKYYGVHRDLEIFLPEYIRNTPKETLVLDEDEQQKLTSVLLITSDINRIGILLSLFMGLRIGEVCAMLWSDIDLEAGVLSVSKTLQRVKNFDKDIAGKTRIVIGAPKSIKSCRTLPIPQFLLQILKEYKSNDDTYITTCKRSFIEPRQYENIFKRYLKEANIRNFNYHALRHTFATRALEKGIDVKTLSDILGHSNVTTTLQLYVHPSMKNKKLCMEKIAS